MLRPTKIFLAALLAALGVRPKSAISQDHSRLSYGDWVGDLSRAGRREFVHFRFSAETTGAKATVDLPLANRWNVRVIEFRTDRGQLEFGIPFGRDTVRFLGTASANSIDAVSVAPSEPLTLHLIHRMAYDSSLVRPLAGNYRISETRIISMGPLDEAGGWLSFFDSQTLRGGILYALNDSVFFTGPSFSIDFPIEIRATVRRNIDGSIRSLSWAEAGKGAHDARRLDDFRQEDVAFYDGAVKLAGNVTVPRKAGRHPAVVLIHGCCGTIPTRDFGYWSVFFAHHGIAVLAFDRRGGGASSGNPNASYDELANDVLAGVELLRARSDIDTSRIGVYGMSNGGYVAPLASVLSKGRIAFVAVRSGSARKVGGNIDYEVGNDLRSEGFDSSDVERGVAIRRRVTEFVISHPTLSNATWDSLKSEVLAVQHERWFPWARVSWVPLISPNDSGGVGYVNTLRTAWQYDPMPYWSQVRVPVYVMLGALDRSVPAQETAARLRAAFRKAGVREATVRVFANGNHGLLVARTGYEREVKSLGYYVPGFQDGLIDWILRAVKRDRQATGAGLAGERKLSTESLP